MSASRSSSGRRILVVVPTLNEDASVAKVVSGVLDAGADVLVVDDGSEDETMPVVEGLAANRPGIHVMQRGRKLGLGSAYRDGFGWAMQRGYDVFGEMDADLSHDPASLPDLIAALEVADLVIGSRYVAGGAVEAWPTSRRWLSQGGNAYVRLWTGLPVRDCTAGFRLFKREVIQEISMSSVKSEGYAFQIEMALRTWRLGFDILEVPITFTERQEGVSKMSNRIVAEALWRVPLWSRNRKSRRPRH